MQEKKKTALLRHAAQTLAAQNRFGVVTPATARAPAWASLASAAATVAASASSALLAGRGGRRGGSSASPLGPRDGPRLSFGQVTPKRAAAAPDPEKVSTGTVAGRWKATAQQLVPGPGAAGLSSKSREFRGMATFHEAAVLQPRAKSSTLWQRSSQMLSGGQPRAGQESGWRLAYRRMRGRPRVMSSQDVGGAAVGGSADGGVRMAEIEEHALALLLRVPSRGELQLRQDAAMAQDGNAADGRAEVDGGRTDGSDHGAGNTPDRPVRPSAARIRWSTAAAVGESREGRDAGGGLSMAGSAAVGWTGDSHMQGHGNGAAGRCSKDPVVARDGGADAAVTNGMATRAKPRLALDLEHSRLPVDRIQVLSGRARDADGGAERDGRGAHGAGAAALWQASRVRQVGGAGGSVESQPTLEVGSDASPAGPEVAGDGTPRIRWQRVKALALPAAEDSSKQVRWCCCSFFVVEPARKPRLEVGIGVADRTLLVWQHWYLLGSRPGREWHGAGPLVTAACWRSWWQPVASVQIAYPESELLAQF